MHNISVSINDYLGKVEGGILTSLSFVYNDEYYEGTIFYNNDNFALTISDELEKELGCDIKDHSSYKDIVLNLFKILIPYNELINRIDDVDIEKEFPLEDRKE